MKTTKIFSALALALMIPVLTFAQTSNQDWKAKIEAAKAEKAELRAQVEAGEITKEEARTQWAEKIAALRAEKEARFQARVDNIKARIAIIAEENPERAAEMTSRLDKALSRREASKAARADIKSKVESGEMTREEAKEAMKAQRASDKEARAETRAETRADYKDQKSKMRKEQAEDRKAYREDMKSQVEAGTITQEEAKAQIEAKREEAKERADRMIENIREVNPERADKIKERRDDRQQRRTDRRGGPNADQG